MKVKNLLSVLFAIIMVFSIIPLELISVNATDASVNVSASVAATRTNMLVNALNGKYFTTNQAICKSSKCDACFNSYIISKPWLKNATGLVPNSYSLMPEHYSSNTSWITSNAWSCAGFANYCLWYIYAQNPSDNVRRTLIYSGSFAKNNMDNSGVRTGDVVRIANHHSFVYISHDSSGVTVLDSNWDYDNKVQKHTIKWSYRSGNTMAITRGKNWTNGSSTPAPNPTIQSSTPNYSSYYKPIGSATVQGIGYEHQGVDLHAPIGTPIYAVASGTIQYSEWGHTVNRGPNETAYSVKIRLDKPFTKNGVKYICAYYTHMSKLVYNVPEKSNKSNTIRVKPGDLIGYSGTANNCPHLHFSFEGDAASNYKMMYTSDVCNMLKVSRGEKWSSAGVIDSVKISSTNNYSVGNYKITGCAVSGKLNVRSTPGGTWVGTKYQGDKLRITEVSGSWGKCEAGWVSLEYCTYLSALEPVINVPAAPSLKLSSSKDCATGSVITVNWSAVPDATGYVLYMKNSAGTVYKKIDWTKGTSATFMVKEGSAGTYSIYGYACNSKYESAKSNVVTVYAHDPSTVSFVDYDGNVISSQRIKYGNTAVAPVPPTRYGFTFTGWSGNYSKVTNNIEVTAQYTRNKYTVKFFNEDGKLLDTQRVYYESAAKAPDYTPSSGYNFVSWDKSFSYITDDTSVTAVVEWYDKDMSVNVSNLAAKRDTDGTGITVTYNVTNQKNEITSARAIVVLKTTEGKLVTTTESAAFSIKNNVTKSQEVFVPTGDGAFKAEVYIVANYKTAVPISENKSVEIDQGATNWSSWTGTNPTGDNVFEVQKRQEYRYRDKKFTTNSKSTLTGWTKYKTTWEWSSYGSWSSWTDTAYSKSDYRDVGTRKVTTGYTPYHYYRYASADGKSGDYYSNGKWVHYEEIWPGYELTDSSFSGGYKYWYNGTNYKTYWRCSDSHVEKTKTQYRYRDRSKIYTYYFWQWGGYSTWSTSKYTATDNREVESRTAYRYRTNDIAGTEDNSGTLRNISGKLDSKYAGKNALLIIYKVDEASDYSNQYIEQLKIGEDGSYSASFKLLSEPTVKSGDYTIMLGVAGTNEAIYIDTIEAPKPEYRVTFYNDNGTVINQQNVVEGENAQVPQPPEKEGYRFVYWDSTATNVRYDLDVYAHYEINTYTVVFVNWSEQTVEVQTYEHGQPIAPPDMNDTESSKAVSWDGLVEGAVTQDMIITAKYQTKTFNVRFIDWDNKLISSQTIEYGQPAEVPDALSGDDYIFFNWASDGDYTYVTEDTVVVPSYLFEQTTEAPVVSIENGDYSTEQTVTITCPTEKSVIYYTIDGSDPNTDGAIEYKGAFKIDRTCELRVVATAFHCNNSREETRYIAINTDHMTSEWVSYDEIPAYVLKNLSEYNLTSDVGYSYKTLSTATTKSAALNLESNGYTLESKEFGEYSQWIIDNDPRNSGILDDLIEPEVEEKTPEAEDTNMYQYSRWKYVADGSTKYSRVEISGTEGEWEYIKLLNKLSISDFDGTAAGYLYNGEIWYNQTIVIEKVVPDYKLYRFRSKNATYSKWTSWTLEKPSQDETREYISGEVYQYTAPKKHVVGLDVTDDGISNPTEYFFNDTNQLLSKTSEQFDIEGYTFDGVFRDSSYSDSWKLTTDTVDKSTTLYLKWTPKTYTVTFVGFNDKVVDTKQVEYLQYAQMPVFEEIDGYVFCGVDAESLLVKGDMTVTAKYVPENEYAKLTIDRSSYALYVGSSFTLTAKITSETSDNITVVWTSSDEEIAYVDDVGKVTAVKEGTATIYATCRESNYTESCKITVSKNVNDSIVISPKAKVSVDDANQLRGIRAGENTVNEVERLFVNDNLKFFDVNGTEISGETLVGTGTQIKLIEGSTILDTITVVITGDMNCDGKVNNRDVAMGTRYLVDKESFGLAQVTAFDVNGDGKTNNRDASMLSRYLVGKENI